MTDLILMDEGKLRQASPGDLARMIVEASELVEKSRQSAQEISNRGFLKRLFSNSTKDLANIVLDQNQALSVFLRMLQTVIWMYLNNTVVLAAINEELNKHERARGEFQNQYLDLARTFLSQAYASAVAFKEQFDQLFALVDQHTREIALQAEAAKTLNDQLSGHIREYKQQIVGMGQRLSSVEQKLAAVRQAMDEHSKSLHKLEGAAAAHDASLDTLSKAVRHHREALSSLEQVVGGHGSAVRALEGAVQALEQADQSSANALGELQNALCDRDEAIRRLGERLDAARAAHSAELQQMRTGFDEATAGLVQAAAAWESGIKALEAQVRRGWILAVGGLCVGVTGILGVLYVIIAS